MQNEEIDIIECWKCGSTTEIDDIDNLIELVCNCGARTKGKRYPQPSSNLFTRRHYEWLVVMAHDIGMTHEQVKLLSEKLEGTNPKYNSMRFRTEFTLYTNKNSGGI